MYMVTFPSCEDLKMISEEYLSFYTATASTAKGEGRPRGQAGEIWEEEREAAPHDSTNHFSSNTAPTTGAIQPTTATHNPAARSNRCSGMSHMSRIGSTHILLC